MGLPVAISCPPHCTPVSSAAAAAAATEAVPQPAVPLLSTTTAAPPSLQHPQCTLPSALVEALDLVASGSCPSSPSPSLEACCRYVLLCVERLSDPMAAWVCVCVGGGGRGSEGVHRVQLLFVRVQCARGGLDSGDSLVCSHYCTNSTLQMWHSQLMLSGINNVADNFDLILAPLSRLLCLPCCAVMCCALCS